MATRADVARLAEVSESTVSYVLSGKRKISESTRQRVEKAMVELGYTKNAVASGLAGGRTHIIAWHFPVGERGLSLTEFEYISAATGRARHLHQHLLLWTAPLDAVEDLERLAGTQLIDGLILTEVIAEDPRMPVMVRADLPFVLVGRPADPGDAAYVDADFHEMGRLAVDHLVELRHRDVAFLADDIELNRVGYGPVVRITAALQHWCQEAGITLHVQEAGTTAESGRQLFTSHLLPEVTAVLGFNPMALVGVIEAVTAQGGSVPEDLSVISLGVSPTTASLTSPPLTTISVSGEVMGELAVSILHDVIEDRPRRQVLVQPTITLGASTGPAPRAT